MLDEHGIGPALFDTKAKAREYAATLTGPPAGKVVRVTLSYSAK